MAEMTTKCYAVTEGRYSGYSVLAIYRRREDAEARAKANNTVARWLVDGEPVDDINALPRATRTVISGRNYIDVDYNRVERNPARESNDELRVEEFDYHEGEALPARLEER